MPKSSLVGMGSEINSMGSLFRSPIRKTIKIPTTSQGKALIQNSPSVHLLSTPIDRPLTKPVETATYIVSPFDLEVK